MQLQVSREKIKFFAFVLLIILSILLSLYFDLDEKISVDGIKELIMGMGIWAPIIYILLYVCTSIIVFPNLLLSIAGGAMWGAYLGTVYTVVGATIGSIIPFLIAKYLGRDFVFHMLKNTKLEVCDRFVVKNGFISVFIARLIPLFPWELVNYGSGLCGVRGREYIFATFLGIIPGSFTYSLIGATLGEPLDKFQLALLFAMVSFIVIVTVLYKVYNADKNSEKK